ncbi:hypothetical protein GX48_05382 [Paracoccidioides brasiliensis]|nr:hypothetical protein GX48_05382 [Paracoccidioides brasiliensis]
MKGGRNEQLAAFRSNQNAECAQHVVQAHRCTLQGELLWGCGGFRLLKRDRLSVDFEIRATRDDTGWKPNSKLKSHCLRTLGGKVTGYEKGGDERSEEEHAEQLQ